MLGANTALSFNHHYTDKRKSNDTAEDAVRLEPRWELIREKQSF